MNLSVAGNAQPNEGLYISRAPDGSSMTFRWAGEYTPFAQAPVPVNYAATLFGDGRIVFNYGSGNQIQAASGSVCGPQASGSSNGHDTYSGVFTFTNYENAANIILSPPFGATSTPTSTVTSPQPGQHVQDLLTVSGTASDSGGALRSVDIFIDGVQRARWRSGGSRVNWTAAGMLNLPSLGLQPGDHTLYLRVANAGGATADVPDPVVTFTLIDRAAPLRPW